MLHIELKDSRETIWRYNLDEEDLYASVLLPWARGESARLGEHFWHADETTVAILEGPELPPGMLTMGRGWLNAKRQGTNVTDAVLIRFRDRYAANVEAAKTSGRPLSVGAPTSNGSSDEASDAGQRLLADAFGLELLRELRDGPRSLHAVWRLSGDWHPQLQPGASLELAMSAVASLVSSGLASLETIGGGAEAGGERVRDIEAWSPESGTAALQIRRC